MKPSPRQRKISSRQKRGASIILIGACAVLLIFAVYLAFKFAMLMGGSSEVRNAVDAAALNVSKKASLIKVPAQPMYKDCADAQGTVGLQNINRVWGKAYLISANLQSMATTGQVGPKAPGNEQMAYDAAQTTNDQLAGSLKNKQVLDQFFNQMAVTRPAKMLGEGATVATDQNAAWATAMVDRGDESNLSVNPAQIPPGVTANAVKRGNKMYMAGYVPMQANGKDFCFTTFHQNEMPHLISDSYFEKNRGDTNPVPSARNPIPNAFKESGSVSASPSVLAAAAAAVANPMHRYNIAIPHSYVAMTFSSRAMWNVEGKVVGVTPYTIPQTQWGVKQYQLPQPNGGKLDGYASLGNEYKRGSIYAVFTTLPGDHNTPLKMMLQRVQEISPNYTLNQLIGLLSSVAFQPGTNTYFIFPKYSSPDLTDPQMTIQPANGALPSWLDPNAEPDGMPALQVAVENKQVDDPNYDWENIVGGKTPNGKHWTEMTGSISWLPGTGGNGYLGVLMISRRTECFFTGEP